MVAPFDIFRAESKGAVLWLGAAEDLDRAKARVQVIGASKPGTYVILNQTTGNNVMVNVDCRGELTISMSSPFEILRIADNEGVLIEGAQSLDVAMVRVGDLRQNAPGDYVVVSRVTGKRILFTANGAIRRT